MSTVPPPISFTGISKFSDSFQTLLERSFTVANLPVKNLQTEQANLLAQQTELSSLAGDVRALRDVFSSLGVLGAQGAVTATSSNTSVATVSITGAPEPLVFDLDVTSAASRAQETSTTGLSSVKSGGLSADGAYTLDLGGVETTFDLLTSGTGRTAGTSGGAPGAPVSVQVDFSGGVSGTITAELESFFVAAAAPASVGAGDTVSVTFASKDGSINETITTAALAGGEDAAALASALNDAIAASGELAGKLTFSDEGGALKLVVSDTAGTGFTFTSKSTGATVSGLEAGGSAGGHSAAEIAAALNAKVALNGTLNSKGVSFSASNGELVVNGNVDFTIDVTDSDQGTGFASGLAGTHDVSLHRNTLAGLRDFLNAGAHGVTATIINVSSDAQNPDYRLTVTADETGATTLTLRDGSAADLLSTANQGADAVFTLNGVAVSNSSNTITDFAPGLSLTIVGEGSTTVAARDDLSGVKAKLTDFAVKYNTVLGRLKSHIGKDAGILSGNVLVRETQSALQKITGFQGSGAIRAQAELGLELDEDGVLSFNSAVFDARAIQGFDDVREFLGSTSTGFTGNAYSRLNDLASEVSGRFETAIDFLQKSDDDLNAQIEREQERIDLLIANLEQKFQAADTLLAALESQQTLLTNLFESNKSNDN